MLDDDATHKTPPVKAWLARHPRYHLHLTPTSASWLNQVAEPGRTAGSRCSRRSRSTAESTAACTNSRPPSTPSSMPEMMTQTVPLGQDRQRHPPRHRAISLRQPRDPYPDLLNEPLIHHTRSAK
jgi:hypothetical protein